MAGEGQAIGGVIGGIAGTLIPIPLVGQAAGAAIGSAIGGGLGSLTQSLATQNDKVPDSESGIIQNNISDLKRGIVARYAGSYAADAMDKLESQFASVKSGIVKSSGNSGSLLKALLSVNRNTGKQFNSVLANIDKGSIARQGIISELIKNIANRKLQTNLIGYSQGMADNVAARKSLSENVAGLAGYLGENNNIGSGINTEYIGERISSYVRDAGLDKLDSKGINSIPNNDIDISSFLNSEPVQIK